MITLWGGVGIMVLMGLFMLCTCCKRAFCDIEKNKVMLGITMTFGLVVFGSAFYGMTVFFSHAGQVCTGNASATKSNLTDYYEWKGMGNPGEIEVNE